MTSAHNMQYLIFFLILIDTARLLITEKNVVTGTPVSEPRVYPGRGTNLV